MRTSTVRLPSSDALVQPGSVVYVVTDMRHDRFISVERTLDHAKGAAEDDNEAVPYFSDTMTWREADPLPPRDGETYWRRQWIGSVVTEPHQPAHEFRVHEQVLIY